ncbi:hypothetical protein IV41_GL001758 [Limosilactobacillus ingluviei]|uniref:Uncharacterized protein n=1 Tax=Limosilactobacillus ingluviei TaxID=148604 RepID=A0A0R2H4S8_9LACO|nr:hypothetical protein IV41_GL001758 [Limosilactobacillus ingluviei]
MPKNYVPKLDHKVRFGSVTTSLTTRLFPIDGGWRVCTFFTKSGEFGVKNCTF